MPAEDTVRLLLGDDAGERLRRHVERQRWFGGQGRELRAVDVLDAVPLRTADPPVWTLLLRAVYADGDEEMYHVPVTRRPVAEAAVTEADDIRVLAVRDDGSGAEVVYDALNDPASVTAMWHAMAAGERHESDAGAVVCRALGDIAAAASPGAVTVRPLGKEQSNSSAIVGDHDLLKCLRRVAPGTSPELEMTSVLAERGFTHVAAPRATMEYHGQAEPILVALVQPFLHNGTEGWALALTSLRVHYADAEEEHLDEEDAARAAQLRGATFTPEAARMGDVTAEMHLALGGDGLPESMRPAPLDADRLGGLAAEMVAELDRVLERGGERTAALRSRRAAIVAAYDAVRGLRLAGTAIRVHGDYHLGQVLRTDEGWTVLDFEGEPDRPLEERRRLQSPLVDVAGMLRSFDYAAAAALSERVAPGLPEFDELLRHGEAWSAANREAFWEAYRARMDGTGLVPEGADALLLRRALELRKAVYEVAYELGHRPDWLGIPVRFLLREADR